MAVQSFPDGIKVGTDVSERLPLYAFNEFVTPDSLDLGTMGPNEVKTLVISGVPLIGYGDTVFARPLNPQDNPTLLVKFVWASDNNEVSIMIKNDIDEEITYSFQSQWLLTYLSTTAPAAPEEP